VWHDGSAKTWKVETDSDSKLYQSVVYSDFIGLSRRQQELLDGGQENMLARVIKRVDNDKQVYDLTVKLIDEFTSFPFGAHDDLLDALSRMYDMDMMEPVNYSTNSMNPQVFFDS